MFRKRQQQGSALLIAVFVLVVMAALTAAITRNISASSDQTVVEVLGTKALFAAEVGNEKKLAQLFSYDGDLNDCGVDEYQYMNSGGSQYVGLEYCAVRTSCSSLPVGGVNYYEISSTGVCKLSFSGVPAEDFVCSAEEVCVNRTVDVEAKL